MNELRDLILSLPSYDCEYLPSRPFQYYSEQGMVKQSEEYPGEYIKRSDIEVLFDKLIKDHPTLPGTIKGTHHGW